jgi:hypothetical protein
VCVAQSRFAGGGSPRATATGMRADRISRRSTVRAANSIPHGMLKCHRRHAMPPSMQRTMLNDTVLTMHPATHSACQTTRSRDALHAPHNHAGASPAVGSHAVGYSRYARVPVAPRCTRCVACCVLGPTSAPGPGSPLPHPRRDRASACCVLCVHACCVLGLLKCAAIPHASR